jgi:hypothetical protein
MKNPIQRKTITKPNIQLNQMLNDKNKKTWVKKKQMNLDDSFKLGLISQIRNPLNLRSEVNQEA